jgi:hypothetical protein
MEITGMLELGQIRREDIENPKGIGYIHWISCYEAGSSEVL